MQLLWSPRSPYVRKVMIVAHETGLADRFDRLRYVADRTRVNPDITRISPVGRIPVLVLDDGITLSGSYPVCQYLDSLHDGRRMLPSEPPHKWRELELHGIADGLLDILMVWRGELMKPNRARAQDICTACETRANACLDWLEARGKSFDNEDYALGQITTGVALGYLDFRFRDLPWRSDRPTLRHWYRSFLERPSSQATEIVNDG